jgi:tungstate transport system substrate-binding protein
LPALGAEAQERVLIVAATTSIQDSGFFNFIIPKFRDRTGITINIVSRSSADALAAARRGSVDVAIANSPAALDRFMDQGDGGRRRKIMFDDFVIVGPVADPAGLRGSKNAAEALRVMARKRAVFISRGDNSGTHVLEESLWEAAGVNPKTRSGNWYRESGLGMGLTVAMAGRINAYVLTDRATWLAEKLPGFEVLVEGDPRLFNQYEIVTANQARHPHVFAKGAAALVDWLVSDDGQNVISSFRLDGQQALHPNSKELN